MLPRTRSRSSLRTVNTTRLIGDRVQTIPSQFTPIYAIFFATPTRHLVTERWVSFVLHMYCTPPRKNHRTLWTSWKKLSSCNVNFCNGTQLHCCVNIYRYACNVSLVEECKMIFVHNMNDEYRAPFEKINFTFICPPPIYLTQNYLYHLRSRFMPNNYRTNIFSVTLISREIFHRPQLNGTPRT